MRLLLAIADENPNTHIAWQKFIPVGIEAIKTFLARNKLMQKEKILTKEINPEMLMLVYKQQTAMATKYLMRKFKEVDINEETKEHSGFVSFAYMQDCFKSSSMLTIKERNLLLREYVMKYGYDKISYDSLEANLIEARVQLLNNRTSGLYVEKYPVEELLQRLADNPEDVKPHMTIQELRHLFYNTKKLVIEPL